MNTQLDRALKRLHVKDAAGQSFSIHVSEPVAGPPAHALVLLPAIAGVNDYIAGIARQYSDVGYLVAVVDYFSRVDAAPDLSTPEHIGAAVASIDDRQVLADIESTLVWLRMRGIARERVGVLGYCIGGTYAVLAAAHPGGPACAAAYYGQLRYRQTTELKPLDPISVAPRLHAPLLAHFGQMDRLIDAQEIADFGASLRSAQRHHEIYTYAGAPHAFDEWFRPAVFRPCASREARERTVTFFDWHLRQSLPF